MDVTLKLKRNTERSDKILFGVAAATTSILALCAAILSYSALRELAVEAGFSEGLSYLFPITLDGLIISGSAMTLFAADRGERSYGGIALTALGVIASIIGNVAVSEQTLLAQTVHAVPPTVLFLSLEGLTSLMRRRINESIARDELSMHEHPSNETPPRLSDNKPSQAFTPIGKEEGSPSPKSVLSDKHSTRASESALTPNVSLPSPEPTLDNLNDEVTPRKADDDNSKVQEDSSPSNQEAMNSSLSIPEQARQLLAEYPNAEVNELASRIQGNDKKYIRRVIRKEKEAIETEK